jgi:hypothetical protein
MSPVMVASKHVSMALAREGLEPDAVLTCHGSPLGGSGDSAGSPPNDPSGDI